MNRQGKGGRDRVRRLTAMTRADFALNNPRIPMLLKGTQQGATAPDGTENGGR